jgi:hypothetical protein
MNVKSISAGLVGFTLLLVGGCAGGVAAPPSAEQARESLVTALDAWKRGDKLADLQACQPALHVSDGDWSEGCKLQAYQILPGQNEQGASLRVKVSLSLRDARGKSVERRVAYFVGMRPVITIVRDFE